VTREPIPAIPGPITGCSIGHTGANVTFESSAFNGPVAEITGKEGKPASLVVRECTFGFLNPTEGISANKFGYFKTENCFTYHMDPYPDVKKWPKLPTMEIPADSEYKAVLPPPMPDCERAIEENLKRQKAWVERLRAAECPQHDGPPRMAFADRVLYCVPMDLSAASPPEEVQCHHVMPH